MTENSYQSTSRSRIRKNIIGLIKKRELRKDLNSLFNYIHVSFFEALGQLLELGIIALFIYKLVETATYY